MGPLLHIVQNAYHATLERHDDPVLRLCAELARDRRTPSSLLLRGNAVNYLARRQHADPLRCGQEEVARPPRMAELISSLAGAGVAMYYVEEDVGERGLAIADLVDVARPVARRALAKFVASFPRVLHW
jgi:hypothetical protein